jgi:hypothetical protein
MDRLLSKEQQQLFSSPIVTEQSIQEVLELLQRNLQLAAKIAILNVMS